MRFKEEVNGPKAFKEEYRDGISELIESRERALDKDELFAAETAEKEAARLKTMCGENGCDWFDFIVFDGVHEFHKDDAPIERLVNDLR